MSIDEVHSTNTATASRPISHRGLGHDVSHRGLGRAQVRRKAIGAAGCVRLGLGGEEKKMLSGKQKLPS